MERITNKENTEVSLGSPDGSKGRRGRRENPHFK